MEMINRLIRELTEAQWHNKISLTEWEVQLTEYVKPGLYRDESAPQLTTLDQILNGKSGTTYRLKRTLEIPSEWQDSAVGLVFEFGGEGLLRINGESYHGLDSNHTYVPLLLNRIGMKPQLDVELFDPIPEPHDPLNAQAVIREPIKRITCELVRPNLPVQSLLYSIIVVRDLLLGLPEREKLALVLNSALKETMDAVANYRTAIAGSSATELNDAEVGKGWMEIEAQLVRKVREQASSEEVTGVMKMVGQSHIDVAWLWPVRETVRKSSRTFSTMNTLMDEYPEFKYAQSQPLLYQFVKDNDPSLYAKIKERVAEGRWELVGGMWIEPDLNLPSGESLIRQLVHGQRFYQQEFGKQVDIEWLPDTFGYCASLPQILQQAGITRFMTSKLNWNDTNVFPYDLFQWQGIDGTQLLTFLNHGLNEHTKPKDIKEHWESFRQKDLHHEQMLLYGHGDGGGGVTREMLEQIKRAELMPGLPKATFGTATEFFDNIGADRTDLPVWQGDLYLELHRGTYTTHARNKRWNRKAEILYREAEVWQQLATPYGVQSDEQAFRDQMDKGWKLLLLNQFHDIIPGSAIPEVYVTSEEEYKSVFEIGDTALEQSLKSISTQISTMGEGKPYVVYNSFGWNRDEIVTIRGGSELSGLAAYDANGVQLPTDVIEKGDSYELFVCVKSIPAFGYCTVWLKQAEQKAMSVETLDLSENWDTDNVTLAFNEAGEIVRWFDKHADRELLKPGAKANELQFFHDKPTLWDAWDIDPRFEQQTAGAVELQSAQVLLRGVTQDILRFEWKLNASTIIQDVHIRHHDGRIDFHTQADWHEAHKLLKAAFDFDIITTKATYEIPFGTLERPTHRNTSWEQAQFEVCGHRFADVSESGYGVSLMNDCKYGYDIHGAKMRLSLLRAPKWPDVGADQGEHAFTYSIYSHRGQWQEAHVVRQAAELNGPLVARAVAAQLGTLPSSHSFVGLESNHVVLDTVKLAEDGEHSVLRFYESAGGRESVSIRWPEPFRQAVLTNALEEEIEPLTIIEGQLKLTFRPYEIKTIKLIR
ncbi:MAG: alpha-mannosidase [Candidatus Cohnella colombiensis]|uniref:alpha-mannosidase n=1 Tax=Candidatus Cohnella colombiensis TaxID=3121368 RepID=A0AA95EYI9_9BACL|nr:MAG: alpha-mannosidase [Cohnella sp.]